MHEYVIYIITTTHGEVMIKTVKEAKRITGGGITKGNTKMPFWSYGISAWDCKVGSVLANKKDTGVKTDDVILQQEATLA